MTIELIPLFIAGCIGLGVLLLGIIVANGLTVSSGRFAAELDSEPNQQDQSARVIRAIGTAFSGIAQPFGNITDKLDKNLMYAGRPYGGVSGQQYLAAAVVLGLLIGAAVGGFFLFMSLVQGAAGNVAFGSGFRWFCFGTIGVTGFLLMDVRSNASRTSDELEREFPFFLDLAVLVVQAGGTPRKSLAKYVEASPGTPLSREIAITAKDADATSFEDALHRMIDRVQPVSVKTILKNLAQGEKSSGEAEEFYSDQAEELRYLREEMASRTAERLKTNIVFPVFLMMTSIILAALTPTIVSIRGQGFF